jgi:hypothetical protein
MNIPCFGTFASASVSDSGTHLINSQHGLNTVRPSFIFGDPRVGILRMGTILVRAFFASDRGAPDRRASTSRCPMPARVSAWRLRQYQAEKLAQRERIRRTPRDGARPIKPSKYATSTTARAAAFLHTAIVVTIGRGTDLVVRHGYMTGHALEERELCGLVLLLSACRW